MTLADLDEQLRIVRFGVHAQDRADAMTAIRNAFAKLKERDIEQIRLLIPDPHGPGGNPNAFNKWS